MPEPSRQDAHAAWDTLEQNAHISTFLVGVATDTQPPIFPAHRLPLGRGQLSVHVADRSVPVKLTPGSAAVGDHAAFVRSLQARMPAGTVSTLLPRRVAVFGAGSLGSTIAELLARNGVGALHLVDDDIVEPENLSRSAYTSLDLGRPKVEALTDRVLSINPLARVTHSRTSISDDTIEELTDVVAWSDLVVAVTDDPRAQAMLDHLMQSLDKPGIFAGVVPGGHLGEMVLVFPGLTTCYRCAAGQHRLTEVRAAMDYSTGRQTGSVALGADVTTVATVTATTTLRLLGLLHGNDESLAGPLREGRSMVQIGLSPDAFMRFPTFRQTPNQHALQSVWMHPEPRTDCAECASLPHREAGAGNRRRRLIAWVGSAINLLRRRRREAPRVSPTPGADPLSVHAADT